MKNVKIYTDGSCSGNPGPGGWAAILIYKDHERSISGGALDTTNNKMEILAAINALSALKDRCEIEMYTDSNYVKQGITSWMFSWVKNGWKNSQKKPVKNVELWKQLSELTKKHNISWNWVKAHSGDEYNEKVDKLAVQARNEFKKHEHYN